MHKVILINAAGTRVETEYESIAKAHGAIGSRWPVLFDGKVGHFDFVKDDAPNVMFVVDVAASEDFALFRYAHLPAHLAAVSRRFYDVAEYIVLSLPDCRQRALALLDLLRAKDAAVRAALAH